MVRNRVLIWVNDTFCRMLERHEEELIGKKTAVLYPSKKEYEWVGQELYAALEKDGFAAQEAELITGSGVILHVIFTITYINPKKPEEGAVFVMTDVSGLKKVERELRESEMKYSQLVRSNPDSIMVVSGGNMFMLIRPLTKSWAIGMRKKWQVWKRIKRCTPISGSLSATAEKWPWMVRSIRLF